MGKMLKVVSLAVFLFAQSASAGSIEVEHYAMSTDMQLPFSEAVRVGHILYLSGQLGFDAYGDLFIQSGPCPIRGSEG